KVPEHDLDHGPEPGDSCPECSSRDRQFGDRGVEHALRTMSFLKSCGDGEHATGRGDVLAEEDDTLVARQLLVECLANGLPEFELWHDDCLLRALDDEAKWRLQVVTDISQEGCCIGAIQNAVIACKRRRHDPSNLELAVDCDRALP